MKTKLDIASQWGLEQISGVGNAMQEYADQQTKELTEEIVGLKEQYTKYYEEHQDNIKTLENLYKETINENIKLTEEIERKDKQNDKFLSEYNLAILERYKENVLLREEIERLKESKWISVELSTPELNQDFDAFVFGKRETNRKGFVGRGWTKESIRECLLMRGCTHWQPLPNNPI